ncbi:catalase-like domain-containing protein [Lasiosphaeris hirsuta]|uniref:Catalase-like domain-containing protein n=1 Tax=Lasiosphaeris hirsuta TaxID=260670 RepID=A0AA40A8Q4_9PEZI|nr:catalase-like domain-containing protein [Lasiosphaeris hirsuta]
MVTPVLADRQPVYTTSNGNPVESQQSYQRIGSNGPLLLQDFHLIDLLAHFDRERIPERVVHAKGAGADITSIDMFNDVCKKMPVLTRFSTTVYLQALTPSEAETFRWNIHDPTKVWPHLAVPLRPLGKLTLNRNPENYFAEIEQVAFYPSHMAPGVEPSADPISVNAARSPVWNPFQRDGPMAINGNYGATPNYPGSYAPLTYREAKPVGEYGVWTGKAVTAVFGEVDEDYVQPRALWEVLGRTEGQQDNFVHNVAVYLSGARVETRERTYRMFKRVDESLGRKIKDETGGWRGRENRRPRRRTHHDRNEVS